MCFHVNLSKKLLSNQFKGASQGEIGVQYPGGIRRICGLHCGNVIKHSFILSVFDQKMAAPVRKLVVYWEGEGSVSCEAALCSGGQ